MANTIKIKRGSGSDPAASDMVLGEPVLRTDTAELFFKKDDGSVAKVSGGGGGPDFKYLALRNAANNGAASYPNADFTLVTSGTTNAKIPTAANTLLVSVNGVIQKPNTGTSTPSAGFAISGSTIKFAANISAAPDFILYQESGGIGEPSDETVSEAKLQVSNSPINGYFLSAQSGNTGGLTWAAPVATSCTGNSATATALATARAINGVNFDGTAAITVTAAAGTLSGNTLNSSVVTSSLTSLGDLTSLTVTGDLVVDTSSLKVDSSNNRVGIGTASPEETLDLGNDTQMNLKIGGRGYIGQAYSTAATIVGHSVKAKTTGTTSGGMIVTETNSGGGAPSALRMQSGNIEFHTAASGTQDADFNSNERMRIDSSGRLLLGTTTEGEGDADDLTVAGSGNTGITIRSGTSNDGAIFFSDGTSGNAEFEGTIQYLHSSNAMTFKTNHAERMRIDSSGKLGIGITSPDCKLHIHEGTAGSIDSVSNSVLTLENNNSVILQMLCPSGSSTQLRFGDESNNGAGFIQYSHPANAMLFATNESERMRIDSSGRLLLGTTTEGQANADNLTIDGGDAETGITIRSGASRGNHIYFSDGTSGADEYRGIISYQHSNNKMQFFTDATERMTIDSAGNVHIGTATNRLGETLHVLGQGIITSSAENTNMMLFGTFGSSTALIGAFNNIPVVFRQNNTERMRIDSSGNVGIKTTSPIGTLDVHDGSFVLSKPNSSGNERNWRFLNNNVAAGNLGLQVSTAAGGSTFSNVIEITKTGNVGLGTGSPVNKLHVNSGSTNTAALFESTDTEVAIQLKDTTGSSYIKARNDFRFDNSTGELMRIDSSGNVMVGCNSTDSNSSIGIRLLEHGTVHSTRSNEFAYVGRRSSSDGGLFLFRRDSSNVGSISVNSSSTAYNTSSDYRLKENVTPISDGITRLKTLKPSRFNFKTNKDLTVDGFLAHEVTAVPEAVTGTKDAVATEDSEEAKKGDPIYQQIDQSKLVPLLVAALQEAIGRIEALEAK